MNFNFTNQPEYELNSSLSDEMISLYGILVKFVITEKINEDRLVFGDFSHLKNSEYKELYVLPQDTENWDDSGYQLTSFGPINFENIVVFAHVNHIPTELNKIVSNLLLFPNNKIMEITDVEINVPGVNNLFTFNDRKTIVKMTCTPYNVKVISELDVIDEDEEEYESLERYFDNLMDRGERLNTEVEVIPSQDTTINKPDKPTEVTKKPIYIESDDIWGKFG